jgi:serine/threonine protein kinase
VPVTDESSEPELFRWLRRAMQASGGELLGSGYQATVHLYRGPFGDVVVKSPHERSLLGRLGRYALRREHRVYLRLEGVPGVPRCLGLLDGKHLVLEHVPGPSLRTHDAQVRDRERFFAALLASIEAIHAAGVAHGDLKRKNNIVVGPDEQPCIVDFGVARLRKPGREGRGGPVFEWVRQTDYNAWAKLKYRRRMEALAPEDAARYRPLRLERFARWIRIPWQKLWRSRPSRQWRARRRNAS